MIQAPTVLIVHDDRSVRSRLAARLQGKVEVLSAATFDEAKTILTASPPTVLITGVRLGEYNGLHLIIRSRIDHPATAGIVIVDEPDATLEAEASSHGAMCVVYPADEDKLIAIVGAAIERLPG